MLSVCVIAKNEEKNMERCLKSVLPYGFELVVADTGSTDATKEIAVRYTPNVYDFTWCDDFAAAKNFVISKATNPYVLVLDADEYIKKADREALECQLADYPDRVGRIKRINYITKSNERQENHEWLNRIFSKDAFCYEGRIHEQVERVAGGGYETYETSVVIGHTGYDLTDEEKQKKAERNLALLREEYARVLAEPDTSKREEKLPYLLYQMGKSCYLIKQYGEAVKYFSEGLSFDLNPGLEYVIDMVETYGYALINGGQAEVALQFEGIYDEFAKNADFLFLMGLIYMNNEMFDRAVEEFQKATTYPASRTKGVNGSLAYYNIGVIYECLGHTDEAVKWYKKCGAYRPAKLRLGVLKK